MIYMPILIRWMSSKVSTAMEIVVPEDIETSDYDEEELPEDGISCNNTGLNKNMCHATMSD